MQIGLTERWDGSPTKSRLAGRFAVEGQSTPAVVRKGRRFWRFHNSLAPEEAGRDHGCGDLSGVNGTPLLRGIEFTHAPSQAGERMTGTGRKSKVQRPKFLQVFCRIAGCLASLL